MKVMLNTKKSQLREVLEALGGTGGDVNVVINIKDEESKEKFSAFAFTEESLAVKGIRNFEINQLNKL